MNIVKQHSEFKLRANKIDSNNYVDLRPSQIDSFLDNAADFMIDNYGELSKFANSQFNKDLFSTLLVKYPDQPELTEPNSTNNQQYEYKLSSLKYTYVHMDRVYIECNNNTIPITMIKHDDQHKFNDSYQKPSYKWKRLLGIIAKSSDSNEASLYVYSDVSLKGKGLRCEYIKYPKRVFFGDYDTIEYLNCKKKATSTSTDCTEFYNTDSAPVNSEFPNTAHSLQVDIAVWLATAKTENQLLNTFIQNKLVNLPR